ncbi:hypothetical protein PTNB85_07015 [Pyrenophora teres f. teres]|nr:hypothetical protein PTNB85_07015 [Pyrenophora teres f. teres]KAE8856284.1 hypothetical protein PTNB29_09123 [Pyrenophora teres f. teres]
MRPALPLLAALAALAPPPAAAVHSTSACNPGERPHCGNANDNKIYCSGGTRPQYELWTCDAAHPYCNDEAQYINKVCKRGKGGAMCCPTRDLGWGGCQAASIVCKI